MTPIEKIITGVKINQTARSGKKNPPRQSTPEILKSFPPASWVFFQTCGFSIAHGVRMPIVKFGKACSIKIPVKKNKIPKAGERN